MNKTTVMDVTKKVLTVIQCNRNDGGLMLSSDNAVSPNAIMYTYGSRDEFKDIIRELEGAFDIFIESDEIGEMTVQAFIEMVVNKAVRTEQAEAKGAYGGSNTVMNTLDVGTKFHVCNGDWDGEIGEIGGVKHIVSGGVSLIDLSERPDCALDIKIKGGSSQ